jgi:hypothetical protein
MPGPLHATVRLRCVLVTRFDAVKATFWSIDTIYGVQPPLTKELVRAAEQELDVQLPADLLELLGIQNGGVVADGWNAFPTAEPTSWSPDHVPFDEVMGIGRTENLNSLFDTPYLIGEWEMPSPLVLLSGDGHYWVALDYRGSGRQGPPAVTWFDTELGTELALATDFRSFVEGLTASDAFSKDDPAT